MRGASGDDPDSGEGPRGSDGGDETDGSTNPATETAAVTDGEGERATPDERDDQTTRHDGSGESSLGDDPEPPATETGATDAVDASEIDPAELTVDERSLHPRIRTIWIVRAIGWSLILGAIAVGATWQWLEITLLAPVGFAAALLVLTVTHAILRYRAWQYEFREDAIYLERGVLTRVRTVVPFVRIQHVDTARGPVDRVAGLSTLVVYTAGSRGADVTIPGIEAERADEHQRRLKQLAIAAEDDTAV